MLILRVFYVRDEDTSATMTRRRKDEFSDTLRNRDRQRRRAVRSQQRTEQSKAKYGPNGKPALVVVRRVEDGAVERIVDQDKFKARTYADSLNREAELAGYGSYEAYLRSPWWKALRLKVLARDQHRCRRCNSRLQLSVHHKHYGNLGRESLSTLETLCATCHRKIHAHHRRKGQT